MKQFARLLITCGLALSLRAQDGLINGDLDTGAIGEVPPGWGAAKNVAQWTDEGCHQGTGCATVSYSGGNGASTLSQFPSAVPYRGKIIRFRAAVRVSGGGRAGLWLRVDRTGGTRGFFENMQGNPLTSTTWQYAEIEAYVHPDAERLNLGLLCFGGRAWLDDASLTIIGDAPTFVNEPARVMTDSGLANLTAFTKLFGIVRHFHPSDQVFAADWGRLAIDGVRRVEGAADAKALAAALHATFEPVAPTIRVYTGDAPKVHPALSPVEGAKITRVHNQGFGEGKGPGGIAYKRTRTTADAKPLQDADLYQLDLGAGVKAIVPLALFKDDEGTLPHAPMPERANRALLAAYSGDDRATRIADVTIAWNVFRHFYPYFDVVKTDWDAVLPWALREAATDAGSAAFRVTLKKLVAELKDGHGYVASQTVQVLGTLPIHGEWIGGKYIVTNSTTEDLKPGDEVVSLCGVPAGQRIAEVEALTSGATEQWKRSRAEIEVLYGPYNTACELTVRSPGAKEMRTVPATFGKFQTLAADPRPTTVSAELEPGIWYFDITRGTDKQFMDLLPKLVEAKGIIFDMRGYPHASANWFSYITTEPLRSEQWHIPLVDRPGEMIFERSGEWTIPVKEPHLTAKKVFLTNGGAISYAETTMGIVEGYKLGEIVGETTAGTNGNVNPFDLPGGYSITWTGMKVLKHDGSQHHGVGIAPTIPVGRTQEGIAAGRDEVLERALAVFRQ